MREKLTSNYDDRQYMGAGDFELYYYQDTGQNKRTGLHSHPYYEFYFFIEGHAEAQVKKEHYMLSYGDILIVPPKTSHGIFVKDFDIPYRRFDLWVSTSMFNRLLGISHDYSYVIDEAVTENRHVIHTDRITFNSVLSKLFFIIEEEKGNRFGRNTQLQISVADLILTINRLASEQFSPHKVTKDALYQNICDYIEHNIDGNLSLDNIADHFFLSKYYISHVFKDNIGISIHQYIAKKRLQLCHDAIMGGEPISQVYNTYGFDDYSSFYRAFKKEYSMSPRKLVAQSKMDTSDAMHPEENES
ncbi:MAG: helix-turn-helix transcriptional regulator [Lachnospiraceae bacterium]|nr:helix-turn-helix transcriptional regulator [Lachnospiraceae bacterium]MBQ8948054.1 helix-turn-helix transcriptional regulator [Lachnospiraceae bacterium]